MSDFYSHRNRSVTPRSTESGFVSPDESSPTPIRRMSSSPSQRRRHRHQQSASSLKAGASSSGVKSATQPRSCTVEVKASVHSRRRPESTDSDDGSF